MSKYRITLNERQILIIEKALNLYSALGISKFSALWTFYNEEMEGVAGHTVRTPLEQFLRSAKGFKEKHFGGSHDISMGDAHEHVKMAFDLQKTIQKAVANDLDPERAQTSVWHHGSWEVSSEELAIVEKDVIVIEVIGLNPDKRKENDN